MYKIVHIIIQMQSNTLILRKINMGIDAAKKRKDS